MNQLGLDQSKLLTPSWNLVPQSYRLAIKAYEQIVVLFFIPFLFSVLGTIYIGRINISQIESNGLNSRQSLGVALMAVWLVISIINFAPAIYFRVEAVKARTLPSLRECYYEGLNQMWRVIASQVIAWFIIITGLFAFIVPGVLFFRRYVMTPFYAIDNPRLKLKDLFIKSSSETRPFMYAVYGAYGVVIIVNLAFQLLFGSFIIGDIIAALLGYSVLFVPVLRYQEISGFKVDVKAKKKSVKFKKT